MDHRPDVDPIPVVLLTGYLGGGKTTLLNHLLSLESVRSRKIALVINEFGSLGVDGTRVRPGEYAKFEINTGSLFCVCTQGQFVKALETILTEVRPDLVLIEATGVAEVRDIETFLTFPQLKDRFRVRANLCVIDAANFIKVLPMMKAVRSQVEWADALVINKTDRIDATGLRQLKDILGSIQPHAPITEVQWGAVPEDFLWHIGHTRREGKLLSAPPGPVFAKSFQTDRTIDRERFIQVLNEMGDKILRLKGYIDFGQGVCYVEKAGDEWIEHPGEGAERSETAFSVIAWQTDPGELVKRFEEAWR
jgi:G3E family GTPase